MRPLLTRAAARAADQDAITRVGVSGLVLMENAGRGAFDILRQAFADRLERVVLVGGPGQNGGDAWVVARHLRRVGCACTALLVIPRADLGALGGDALPNWRALAGLDVAHQVLDPEDLPTLRAALQEASLVVDGLFGTGLTRPIEGPFEGVVRAINECDAPVLSLDLPSGVDADTGAVLGVAVQAAATVTFAAHKRGLSQHPGLQYAGALHVADIGVPVGEGASDGLLQRSDLAAWLGPRGPAAHKGTAGHVAVFGGDAGTTGAAFLAGLGAKRAGAGLVTLVAPEAGRRVLEQKVVEMMTRELPGTGPLALDEVLHGKNAVVMGPGLGFSDAAQQALAHVTATAAGSPARPGVPALLAVLDADALTWLAERGLETLREGDVGERSRTLVLTPHPGEAARLLGVSSAEVQADRYAAAEALAARSGQVCVLKGAQTIVAQPATAQAPAALRVCPFGTPAMGSGGTGDVLAGVIGALLGGRELTAFDAACAGVLWHALAGEAAAQADRGLLASELAHALPAVLRRAEASMTR